MPIRFCTGGELLAATRLVGCSTPRTLLGSSTREVQERLLVLSPLAVTGPLVFSAHSWLCAHDGSRLARLAGMRKFPLRFKVKGFELPRACKVIYDLRSENASLRAENSSLRDENASQAAEIERLRAQLAQI